jgi:hypothetical protein
MEIKKIKLLLPISLMAVLAIILIVTYLMTYGWAILIILIVAGVLAYYGIFAPSGFLGPSAKGWTQIYALQPWDLAADGTLKLQLENRVGQDIIIVGVKADSGTTASTNCTQTVHTCTSGNCIPSGTITSGTKYPTSGLMILDCTGTLGGSTGSSYTITVEVDYTVGGTVLKQTGTLSGSRS